MDKINIYNTRKNILIKQQGLIDAIVSARNNAFIIEHSKEINFDIFKEQSQYFRDENNKDSLLQSIAELNKEEYEKNPKNFGTQYLNAIDATISTSFKSVPIFLEDVLTILKDVEDSLANNKTIKETPKEAIDELCAQINNNIKKIENPSINTFKDKLDEHIKIYKNILQCCNNDKEQREINIENDNNDYEKNYLTYQENIFILDTAICSLTNIINGSCDISENLASIKKYYTTLNEITNIPSTLVKDKYQEATIQMALSRIRNLIARLKGQLTKIKTFTSQL